MKNVSDLLQAIGKRLNRDLARSTRRALEDAKILSARLLIDRLRAQGPLPRLRDAEFRVFSQFGDDGIIQYLIHLLEPVEERFIEFGVEDYGESNTRFLLMNDNWTGLVIDGSREHVAHICRQDYHSRHTLTAAHAFVDRSNVNALFRDNGFTGGLGLLSIDIDGNDYWVWEAIDCVEPVVVVCEYNAVFGASRAVTVPYEPTFQRTRAHPSNLYFGASLGALCLLAGRKGFAFVGANSAGNNAYFVRQDRLGPLRALRAEQGFVDSRFRESRDAEGRFTFLSGPARREAIADMEVVDLVANRTIRVGEIANP
jgi:hypothetical protein